jgi:hypothetical protein
MSAHSQLLFLQMILFGAAVRLEENTGMQGRWALDLLHVVVSDRRYLTTVKLMKVLGCKLHARMHTVWIFNQEAKGRCQVSRREMLMGV